MPDGTLPAQRRTLRDAAALVAAGLVTPADRDAIAGVAARYAVAIPPALADLIAHPDDPIGRQFVPHADELHTAPHEQSDPIADEALSPVPGIVHRYPDRALLKPLLACPVYCRFCFRREQVGPDGGVLTEAELAVAYDWLRAHPGIREVILTGGEPLLLSPRRLRAILAALSAIPHVELLRVHTRLPVADPVRLDEALADALDAELPLWLVVHINHAREITAAARDALRRVQARGIPVLGQAVLLRGVNDNVEALDTLFRAMLGVRVKPVLPPPARSRSRYRAFPRADRRGSAPAHRAPRPDQRARLADLRARHTGRARQGAARADLSGGGRQRARARAIA